MALRDTLFLGGKVINVSVNRAGPKVLTTRLLRIVKVSRPLPPTGSSIQWLLAHVLRHADGKGGSVSNLFDKMIYMYFECGGRKVHFVPICNMQAVIILKVTY